MGWPVRRGVWVWRTDTLLESREERNQLLREPLPFSTLSTAQYHGLLPSVRQPPLSPRGEEDLWGKRTGEFRERESFPCNTPQFLYLWRIGLTCYQDRVPPSSGKEISRFLATMLPLSLVCSSSHWNQTPNSLILLRLLGSIVEFVPRRLWDRLE